MNARTRSREQISRARGTRHVALGAGMVACGDACREPQARIPSSHGRGAGWADAEATPPQTPQQIQAIATTRKGTHLGALRGLRPSTMHGCPPPLQRLHVFSPVGNSHLICDAGRVTEHDPVFRGGGSSSRPMGRGWPRIAPADGIVCVHTADRAKRGDVRGTATRRNRPPVTRTRHIGTGTAPPQRNRIHRSARCRGEEHHMRG
ncbi:hypothetical protein OBBRIDRAFT_456534 [Obba rivulosa]|uniref:Uncharacterized protein n=1 Tax=Obba rivulosa TaxID=1052685 RepID=A0A8E2AWS4_9APHY|nr:hypothetical protein OBBRIDRAFT_456534 [Obba rivulosa]